MDENKKSFVHDTIDLDEIRELLGDGEHSENTVTFDESVSQADEQEPAVFAQEEDIADMDADEDDVEVSLTDETEDEEDISAESEETEAAEPAENAAAVDPVPKKKKTSLLSELYSMLHDVIYLLAAVTLIFVFVVRLVGVKGDSMLPTLHNQDYLVLESNFLFGSRNLEYGDVVVLNAPNYQQSGDGPIVKRVIATEGQTVDIDFDNGVVYVDGVRLAEDYVNSPTNYNWEGEFGMDYPVTVPEGCIFVLGDNRNNSMDSRYAPIGMVDEQYVLGKVLFIILPGQTTDDAGNVIEPRNWGRIGLVS